MTTLHYKHMPVSAHNCNIITTSMIYMMTLHSLLTSAIIRKEKEEAKEA